MVICKANKNRKAAEGLRAAAAAALHGWLPTTALQATCPCRLIEIEIEMPPASHPIRFASFAPPLHTHALSPTDEKVEYSYINLLRNSERYTGYKGEHAARVWGAIYGQKMFAGAADPANCPPEQRVFYRCVHVWGGCTCCVSSLLACLGACLLGSLLGLVGCAFKHSVLLPG